MRRSTNWKNIYQKMQTILIKRNYLAKRFKICNWNVETPLYIFSFLNFAIQARIEIVVIFLNGKSMFVPSLPNGCVWTIELLSKGSTMEGVCRSILLIHPPKECSKWQLANYGDIREDTPILVNKPPQQNVVFPGMEEDRVSGSKWRNFDSHKFYALKLLDLSLGALA